MALTGSELGTRAEGVPGAVGWTLFVGGLCHALVFATFGLLISGVIPGNSFLDREHWFAHLLEVPGMALLALGTARLYGFHRGASGRLGTVGACLMVGGLGLEALAGALIAIGEPLTGIDTRDGLWMVPTHLPGLMGIVVGSLLFGIAIARAGVLPRWVGGCVVAAVGLFVVGAVMQLGEGPMLAAPALISATWAAVGATLMVVRRAPAPVPAHA